VCQECFDLRSGRAKVLARPQAIEMDELYDPIYIGALSVHGGVMETEPLAHILEEFWWLTSRRVRHRRSPSWHAEITDNKRRAKLPDNSFNIHIIRAKGPVNQWFGFKRPVVLE